MFCKRWVFRLVQVSESDHDQGNIPVQRAKSQNRFPSAYNPSLTRSLRSPFARDPHNLRRWLPTHSSPHTFRASARERLPSQEPEQISSAYHISVYSLRLSFLLNSYQGTKAGGIHGHSCLLRSPGSVLGQNLTGHGCLK